jgi:3-oxoacyl-[acyl-carrier protein] reductase
LDHLILSNTARAGLTGFLKTLATEVAPYGVTVNSVLPAGHATPRIKELYGDSSEILKDIPVGVLGDPEDFGAVITFLASRHARHITGAALPIDGGMYRGLL